MAPRGGPADDGLILDVALDDRLEHGARLPVRAGGRATQARVGWLGGLFHQLRCDQRLGAAAGDPIEVDGVAGVVLDPCALRHGPDNDVLVRLARLQRGQPESGLPPLDAAALALEARYLEAGADPPADGELDEDGRAALFALREAGRVVRMGPGRHRHVDA